jgi:hypothetical protein
MICELKEERGPARRALLRFVRKQEESRRWNDEEVDILLCKQFTTSSVGSRGGGIVFFGL